MVSYYCHGSMSHGSDPPTFTLTCYAPLSTHLAIYFTQMVVIMDYLTFNENSCNKSQRDAEFLKFI